MSPGLGVPPARHPPVAERQPPHLLRLRGLQRVPRPLPPAVPVPRPPVAPVPRLLRRRERPACSIPVITTVPESESVGAESAHAATAIRTRIRLVIRESQPGGVTVRVSYGHLVGGLLQLRVCGNSTLSAHPPRAYPRGGILATEPRGVGRDARAQRQREPVRPRQRCPPTPPAARAPSTGSRPPGRAEVPRRPKSRPLPQGAPRSAS